MGTEKNMYNLNYITINNAVNSINREGYKPTDVINNFWNKYRLQEGFANVHQLFLRINGKGSDLFATLDELDEYVEDLMSLIIAYYFSHLNVFEKGEVIIDERKSFPDDIPPEQVELEVLIKRWFDINR